MYKPRFYLVAGLAAVLAVLLVSSEAVAQNQNFQKVRFETYDGVDIHGFWYSSVRNAPVVMILHDVGQTCNRREWNNLANALQKAGYAVLAFDFRGHGASTDVNAQAFQRLNPTIKVQAGGTIDAKTFPAAYIPTLVNDIAAARAFLDIKNDQGECNSSSLILIGAGQGATLGSVWLNSEWSRYQIMKIPQGIGFRKHPNKTPSGKDTVAAVWLSMSHHLGKRALTKSIPTMLKRAADDGMGMVFMYNSDDKVQKTIADYCVDKLKDKNKANKQKFLGSAGVKAGANLSGHELLTDQQIPQIIEWLETLKNNAKFNNWVQQRFQQTEYWWITPGNRTVPATLGAGETTFRFMNFASFIP